jgi:hypothetical protein
MLVGVGQQSQDACALDGCVELTLENGAGASQTCRNDLAVFGNEVAQGVDIFLVNFFDARDCEAAEALALEQQGLGIALRALVFVEFFERGHEGLLELILLKLLNVQHDTFALPRGGQKALERPNAANRLIAQSFSQ